MNQVIQRFCQVRERISVAAGERTDVTLVVASKMISLDVLRPLIALGQRDFGENRVQEAAMKWAGVRTDLPDLTLHLIGPLQSNKVRQAVALFDVIHVVDRPGIAEALAGEIARTGKKPGLLVQVNTGEEPQKAGVAPRDAKAFVASCREQYGLCIDGLTCIPPIGDEVALHFSLLRKIADEVGVSDLSMGMSDDYEKAIAYGATYVRVGRAIFGERC